MKNIIDSGILLLFVTLMSFNIKEYKKTRPFCCFHIENGKGSWYYETQELRYITKKAKIGDDSGIPEVVSQIENKIGFKVQIDVYLAQDEHNCFATIGQGGTKLLITDVDFLEEVNSGAHTKWAAISVIAHEIGHHIAGFNHHANQLDNELDADYWSGYALYRLGASENTSTKCIMTFGTDEDTQSHPNKYTRATIIKKGWEDSQKGSIDYSRCQNCKP